MNIINYLVSEYKDITKLIGMYFVLLSFMVQLNIEKPNEEIIKLLKSPLAYFILVLSVSLIVTNDDVYLSLICSVLYFIILLLTNKYAEFKMHKSKSTV